MYMYGSEVTYLNAVLEVVTPQQAALPPLYGRKAYTHLEENSSEIEEPSHVKQLSLNHMSKIRLNIKGFCFHHFPL
jgi:hypothetical protein